MNDAHTEAVNQTIQYMKEHLDEPMTTEQLADLAGYSPYHFSRVFKRVTGISLRQYLSALRVESGKIELLQSPSLLVKIAVCRSVSEKVPLHHRVPASLRESI